jgi:hypothetical protein
MELNPARGEPRELRLDIGNARIVEQHLTRFMIRGVNRHVERRQSVLQNPLDVLVLHVGERREVSIREGETIIVVTDIERLAETGWQSFDETELAAVRAAPHGRRLQRETQRLAVQSLELVDDRLAIGLAGLDDELFVGGEKFPVEEISNRPAVDDEQLRSWLNSKRCGDAFLLDAGDFYHS